MSTPLIIGTKEKAALAVLRDLAIANPVDIRAVIESIKTPAGKAAHMRAMTAQSIEIPANFLVTFSVELGHPVGTCRHMSMSVGKASRVPNPHALWLVAQELGFTDGLDYCTHWLEELQGHGTAVNVVQPVMAKAGRA
jgi:hypothetical protein